MNETPLKYTAGMVLAVPVDCELFNISDISLIRLSIKTPDQRVQLITPKQSHFFAKDAATGHYRLLTDALMSQVHVWSEALHVEISVVLDLGGRTRRDKGAHAQFTGKATATTLELCDPVRVCVLPKAIKRGI
jgi:integrator complex subunit 4